MLLIGPNWFSFCYKFFNKLMANIFFLFFIFALYLVGFEFEIFQTQVKYEITRLCFDSFIVKFIFAMEKIKIKK